MERGKKNLRVLECDTYSDDLQPLPIEGALRHDPVERVAGLKRRFLGTPSLSRRAPKSPFPIKTPGLPRKSPELCLCFPLSTREAPGSGLESG